MDEEKMVRAQAHAIALEQNQMALHKRIADLQGQLQDAGEALATSVLREADLQTKVNLALAFVDAATVERDGDEWAEITSPWECWKSLVDAYFRPAMMK